MVQFLAVYGEWFKEDTSWQFAVDNERGGRLFFLHDGSTHAELVEMVQDEYMLGKKTELVEITYSLPESILGQMDPDTPPIHVANDRQVRNLIELGKTHVIRICVSCHFDEDKASDEDEDDNDGNYEDEGVDENEGEFKDEDAEDAEEDEHVDEDAGVGGNLDDDGNGDDGIKTEDAVDEDYSLFGKVKDEDEDDISFDFIGGQGGSIPNMTWSDNIFVKQSFATKEELVSALRLTAIKSRFAFKVYKSSKKMFVATCIVKECKWRLRAIVTNEPNRFWVTKYSKVHTCSLSDRVSHRRNATPKYIGKLFIDRVGIINGITPEHIKDSMKKMFGMNIDYFTSYRSLRCAQQLVRGTAEDGYEKLPSYLHLLEKANPGTVTGIELDAMNRFKYLFIAFGASIAGFQYLRRVIVVDGTHLTGKYEGVLLVAAAQDGNFQIFPLAFGIVDSENDASWEWFFTKLRGCISDQYPLVIVSDRHLSIKKACDTVFPWATRGICYYHLQCNIVTKYKGKHLMYLVKGAAYAYTEEDYDRYMASIRSVKPELAVYLEEADPKLWSRVHFEGDRYNIKTTNIAESINAAIKKAKGFPIAFLLEFIREKLGRWFSKRREDALSLTTHHSRGVETLLAIREDYASRMTVEKINEWEFHVKGGAREALVHLGNKKCSCGVFYTEKIPCSHAIAALASARQHVSTAVCPSYGRDYLYAAYSQNIYPANDALQGSGTASCLPPDVRPRAGRKKKSRWQTWLEIAKMKATKPRKLHNQYNCSKCKQGGHTKPNCVT